MAVINNKDIAKMSNAERTEKVKDLRMELMKERVNVAKGGKIKIREMKRTIAKLLTFNRLEQPEGSSRLSKSKDSGQLNKSVDNK
jgi:ribosomal protein L29